MLNNPVEQIILVILSHTGGSGAIAVIDVPAPVLNHGSDFPRNETHSIRQFIFIVLHAMKNG